MSYLTQFKQGGLWFRGAYVEGVPYYRNNVLTYNNSVYICTAPQSIGNLPTNTAYFDLLTAPPDVSVATTGSGTTPANFTLSSNGSTITLNKPA